MEGEHRLAMIRAPNLVDIPTRRNLMRLLRAVLVCLVLIGFSAVARAGARSKEYPPVAGPGVRRGPAGQARTEPRPAAFLAERQELVSLDRALLD